MIRRVLRLVRVVLLLALGFVAASVTLTSCTSTGGPVAPPRDASLRVATWNVHYIVLGQADGPWSVGDWERRKGAVDAAFKALKADLVGFQEMESFQRGGGDLNLTLDWLLERNPGYAAAAVGPYEDFPSTQPILYRRDRLRLVDQGWWFFSDTPDVIYSRTFNGSYPAFASWARFEDRGGRQFRVVNVHFEFSSASNRRKSAELSAARMAPWLEAGDRVVLLGDLNALWFGTPLRIFEGIGLRFLPVRGATYHLNRGLNVLGAIDHIALSPGIEAVGETQVLRAQFGGVWPSDHYPVVADVRLGP